MGEIEKKLKEKNQKLKKGKAEEKESREEIENMRKSGLFPCGTCDVRISKTYNVILYKNKRAILRKTKIGLKWI